MTLLSGTSARTKRDVQPQAVGDTAVSALLPEGTPRARACRTCSDAASLIREFFLTLFTIRANTKMMATNQSYLRPGC